MNEEQKDLLEKIKPTLHGRDYCIEGLLAGGSFGLVFKVKSIDDERQYAVKVVHVSRDNRENAKYQRRELELLTSYSVELARKNIVRYYRSWQSYIDNTQFLFILMELCLTNLEYFIYDVQGPQIINISSPKPLWAQVFPQILNGLKAIHQIGWVHRDIHPGNILIAYPEPREITEIVVKIADFGLAREIHSSLQSSFWLTVAPTVPRLSPEFGHAMFRAPELKTDCYDYKVDLYSAGIILYFLSCYLPDKNQWPDEIKELRNGNRDRQHLSHQNDLLFNLIESLMKANPNERPTADMALKYIEAWSKGLTKKKFLVKKQGDDTYYICTTNDNTLGSLKVAIQEHSHIGIEADAQILKHEFFDNDDTCILVDLQSDQDVRQMFLSAEKDAEKARIVVSRSFENDIEEAVDHL